jgi:hypothetical protein
LLKSCTEKNSSCYDLKRGEKMPNDDFFDSDYHDEGSFSKSPHKQRRSILIAAVMGLILFLLALAGIALINESGLSNGEEPPFLESAENSTSSTPVLEPGDFIPGEPLEEEIEETFCTLDAKICPDGSSVGRSGPNCEFAPCPAEN